jgi:hypothetical protein
MPWRHMGEWRYSSTILCLSSRWRWVISFTPQPLYPRGESSRYPLDRRLGRPQSRSGRRGEEKHFALPGIVRSLKERRWNLNFLTWMSFFSVKFQLLCTVGETRQVCSFVPQGTVSVETVVPYSWGVAPCTLNLRTRLWWVVSFTPPLIYSRGKRRQCPFDGTLCACLDAEAHRTIPGTSPRSLVQCQGWENFAPQGPDCELSVFYRAGKRSARRYKVFVVYFPYFEKKKINVGLCEHHAVCFKQWSLSWYRRGT